MAWGSATWAAYQAAFKVLVSRGDGSEMRSPMAIIAIGGLLTSTFLTLLVVPVIYTLFDNAGTALLRLFGVSQDEDREPLPAPGPESESG